MKYLSFRADSGGETGSHYLQALAAFLRENYLEFPLDRIYLMVKQYMIEVEEVSTLHWSFDNDRTCYMQGVNDVSVIIAIFQHQICKLAKRVVTHGQQQYVVTYFRHKKSLL